MSYEPPAPPPPGPPGPPAGQLADWGTRALGYLVDAAFSIAIIVVGFILAAILHGIGFLFLLLAYVAAFAYWIIQLIKQGNTGQTIGKKVVGLKLVKEETGQPVGPGLSVGRWFAHIIDSVICYIGWLFPLWDAKRQTIADKVMGTVVVVVPKQPFNAADLYTTN